MRAACAAGIVIVTAFSIITSVVFAAMCAPRTGISQIDYLAPFVSNPWSRTRSLVVIQGIGNVVTDFYLVILPLPAVWRLQMPLERKIGLFSMFMFGFW